MAIGLVMLGLRFARARAIAHPVSVWGRNAEVLTLGNVVALVYLAGVVVTLVEREVRMFLEISIGNAAQIDMFSPAARFCMAVVLPTLGAVLVLLLALAVESEHRHGHALR